ncbi:MAG: septal ring lytic transglycosylase RlpA family protein [Pseudomonadota bacterium]
MLCSWLVLVITLFLGACSSVQKPRQDGPPVDESVVVHNSNDYPPDAVPKHEPRSKYGNPPSYVVFGKTYKTLSSSHGFVQRGIASWYGKKFHGRRTSSGETYDMYAMTAAHTQLPLPTYVQVTNLKNGKQVILKVNDRGPFHGNRIIDLSYSAAKRLDIIQQGTGLVEVRALDPGNYLLSKQKKVQNSEEISVDSNPESVEKAESDATVISASGPKVFVQVGAFGQRENANQLVNQLNALNLGNVSISSVIKNSQPLHRVRIGPMVTVESADQTVAQLNEMGMKDHRVVIE